MSYRTYPIDQLMQLSPAHLKTALRLFEQELDGTIKFLNEDATARRDAATLEELENVLTLRKVVLLRLEELKDVQEQPLTAEGMVKVLELQQVA